MKEIVIFADGIIVESSLCKSEHGDRSEVFRDSELKLDCMVSKLILNMT